MIFHFIIVLWIMEMRGIEFLNWFVVNLGKFETKNDCYFCDFSLVIFYDLIEYYRNFLCGIQRKC